MTSYLFVDYRWDTNTATPMEGVWKSQWGLYQKINPILRLWVYLYFCSCVPGCLDRLTWRAREIRGKWQYIICFVGCCVQHLFKTARRILTATIQLYLRGNSFEKSRFISWYTLDMTLNCSWWWGSIFPMTRRSCTSYGPMSGSINLFKN